MCKEGEFIIPVYNCLSLFLLNIYLYNKNNNYMLANKVRELPNFANLGRQVNLGKQANLPNVDRQGQKPAMKPKQVLGTEFSYDIGKFLGNGSFGATYKAINTDPATGNRTNVAIKFIFPVSGESGMTQGLREVQNYMEVAGIANANGITKISCQRNLLCFHAAGEITSRDPSYKFVFDLLTSVYKTLGRRKPLDTKLPIIYIVTDFLEGDDLSKLIKDGFKVSDAEARNFLSDMLYALQYLHKRRIAHRDVKPENIIRTKDGNYVLIDFGIVCATDLCQVHGTLFYLTNEILMLSDAGSFVPLQMSCAGDIFALGLSLYEFINRKRLHIPRLKNYIFKSTDLPILDTKSKFINDVYENLIFNYDYIVNDPTSIPSLLKLL